MSRVAIDYLAREAHILFSIIWIGALYYLIVAEGAYLKETDPTYSSDEFPKRVPRVSLYLRYAALATFLTGSYMMATRHPRWTIDAAVGSALGTLMLVNVLFIAWPKQRTLTANRQQSGPGGHMPAKVASAAAKLALASRTNMVFVIPTLIFMSSSAHLPHGMLKNKLVAFEVALGIAVAIELNAIFGKLGPMASSRGLALTTLVVTAVLWVVVQNL
jgi:uncharacterized membrane protein